MVLTLLITLVVVPKLIMSWNFKLQAKDDRGVLVDNYEVMHYYLKHEISSRMQLDLLVVSLKEVTATGENEAAAPEPQAPAEESADEPPTLRLPKQAK